MTIMEIILIILLYLDTFVIWYLMIKIQSKIDKIPTITEKGE